MPEQVHVEFAALLALGAAAGYPCDPVPVLDPHLTRSGRGTHVALGDDAGTRRRREGSAPEVPVVRLDAATAAGPAADRAWTMAHELGHVLDRRLGSDRPPPPAALVLEFVVVGAARWVTLLLAAGAAGLFLRPGVEHRAVLAAAAAALLVLAVAVAVRWFVLTSSSERAGEVRADHLAATVYGQVLSPACVRRIERSDLGSALWIPTWLNTHPRPAARRAAALAALGTPPRLPAPSASTRGGA